MNKCKKFVEADAHVRPSTKARQNKGITLIALIITIILMLILATITVNVVIDGGLFEYAGNAKDSTEIASEKEAVQKAVVLAESTSKTGRVTIEDMQTAINKVASENTARAINYGESIIIEFNNSQRYYEINKKGNIEGPIEIEVDITPGTLDGTGAEDDPFIIMSIEDLVYFSQQVNVNRVNYSKKYVILGRSLDFNSELSYEDYTTTEYDIYLGGDGTTGLKEQLTNGNGFRPIGEHHGIPFCGNFNGDNNTIYNINIDVILERDGSSAGLFGVISGANISNVTVTGNVKPNHSAGGIGIIGWIRSYSVVSNCRNMCDISGDAPGGGIVGRADGESKIINCSNNGRIKIENSDTGGILGHVYNSQSVTTVINCYNLGAVESFGTSTNKGAGGIIGSTKNGEGTIINCYNFGNVTGHDQQGAILGHYWYYTWLSTLENCYYLESSCDCPVKEEGDVTEGTISCTREYMQSEEFINELNAYVDTYNEEHKEDEDFIELKKWEKGANGYPSFVNNN